MSVKWIIRIVICILFLLAITASIIAFISLKGEKEKSKNIQLELDRVLVSNSQYRANLKKIEIYVERGNNLEKQQRTEKKEFHNSNDRRNLVCNAIDRLYYN